MTRFANLKQRYDMPVKILMPALSPTMKEGNLAKWALKEGDEVKAGDVLAEIETDKATMEVEAVDEGTLAKILVKSGTKNVAVGSLIAVLLEEGEDKKSLDSFIKENSKPKEATAPAKEEAKQSEVKPTPAPSAPAPKSDSRILASPLAKRIAGQEGISLGNIQGSGPKGRIVKADLASGSKGIVTRNSVESSIKEHSTIRSVIAGRLQESKQTIPHFYLNVECNLDKLLEARADINSMSDPNNPYKISVNDLVIKAASYALRDVPEANASWSDDGMIVYNNVDVSVAVAIDEGLITPIVKNADQKDLINISGEMKSLAARAKEGALAPDEYQGGAFCVSNLGMYNIKRFNAIINPPQSSILAVGAGEKRPVVVGDELCVSTIMDVTLSCDHRVIDGAVAANFINRFKDYIEHPVKMLI
jgi:pyruvate dehydrogenase E2 component (dihydrolipoamide acetyltransferase)